MGKIVKNVMLNLFQHLIKSNGYETLKRVQGDKEGLGIIHKRFIWLL